MRHVIKTRRFTLGVALGRGQGHGSNSNANGPRLVRLRSKAMRGGTLWFRGGRIWASVQRGPDDA